MPRFNITILKETNGYKWVNAYEVDAPNLGTAATIGDALVTAEQGIHANSVNILAMKASAVPNPSGQNFIVHEFSVTGNNAFTNATRIGPSVVLLARFNALTGRPGKKMYRYALDEGDMISSGEGYQFTSTAARNTYETRLDAITAAVANAGGVLLIGASGKNATGSSTAAIATLRTRHGWFNRTPSTGPSAGASI